MDLTRVTEITPEVVRAIEKSFAYQLWTAEQIERGTRVRDALTEAFKAIIANAPPCSDRSSALRKLREARLDANSAITFGPAY